MEGDLNMKGDVKRKDEHGQENCRTAKAEEPRNDDKRAEREGGSRNPLKDRREKKEGDVKSV